MTHRIASAVGAPLPDFTNAGMRSVRGSRPTTHGLPVFRIASTSRSENSFMALVFLPTSQYSGHTVCRGRITSDDLASSFDFTRDWLLVGRAPGVCPNAFPCAAGPE